MTKINTTATLVLVVSLLLGVFIGYALCTLIPAFGETLVIEGSNEKEGIFISIDGDRNTIILDTLDDPILDSKMKTYHTGAFSLKNSERDVKIWVHPFSDTQYRIVIKSSDGVHNIQKIIGTIVVSEEKRSTIGQRDLGSALQDKQELEAQDKLNNMTPKDRMLYEKQQKLQEAKDRYQKLLESVREGTGSDAILKAANDAKNQTGMGLVKPKTPGIIKTPVNSSDEFKIKAFGSIASRVSQQENLKIQVLVTDDTKSNAHGVFGWVGLGISNAKIVGQITDPQGKVIDAFDGKSSGNGIFEHKYFVPTNAPTRGEYGVSITVTKDTAKPIILTDTFFVLAIDRGSFDNPPVSIAGIDQDIQEHSNILYNHTNSEGKVISSELLYTKIHLDGSNSNDSDSHITYLWKQLNGTKVRLNDYTISNPWFNSTNIGEVVNQTSTGYRHVLSNSTMIEFELTVKGQLKYDTDKILVTMNYVNQTQKVLDILKQTLEESMRGDDFDYIQKTKELKNRD